MRVGILTISDRASRGEYADLSGPSLREVIKRYFDEEVDLAAIVPDEQRKISATLRKWCDREKLDLILTTGGTGFAPRDVTPEATRAVIDKETPGLVQAMIADSLKKTPHAMLTRMAAGIRGNTLIVNLPGSPSAATENLQVIIATLPHAIELLRGKPGHSHAFGDADDKELK
jgi:molybdopterin adenylyltransferase